MLSSIHPFGERSRNNSFWVTAWAHVLGSTLGGLVLGTILGSIGSITAFVWPAASPSRPLVLGVAAAAGALFEATGRQRMLPTRLHQVDENWLQRYRGWVYGGGFGLELGFGLSTIITTALVHVMVAAMVLAGSVGAAMVIGAVFGGVRGAAVFSARRIDSHDVLREFHSKLADRAAASRRYGVAALGLTSLIGLSAVLL